MSYQPNAAAHGCTAQPKPSQFAGAALKHKPYIFALLLIIQAASVHAQKLNVSRLQLKNGLVILALEDHTVPAVAYYTVFKVGSRNERPGITGLSHLFE